MEREAFYHDVPCSSIAVESAIRVGTAGAIWGLCSGPYDATKQGLSGLARASFVAKSIGGIGLQCVNSQSQLSAFVEFVSLVSHGHVKYKHLTSYPTSPVSKKNDYHILELKAHDLGLVRDARDAPMCAKCMTRRPFVSHVGQGELQVNSCIAGAVAGSAVAARTRSWKNVAQVAGLVSVFSGAADYTKVL
ncbi:unnamed protein product [Rhodiola kirilowii]